FMAGATSACFGAKPQEMVGRSLLDLVASADRSLMNDILEKARQHGKIDDLLVHVINVQGKETRTAVSGYQVPDYSDNFYLGLKLSPRPIGPPVKVESKTDRETGLLDKTSFTATAATVATAFARVGEQPQVTLVKIAGLEDLTHKMDAAQRSKVLGSIGQSLKAASIDGDVAGRMNADTFGFLHSKDVSGEAIARNIEQAVETASPEGAKIQPSVMTLDTEAGDITPEQVAKALAHTIQQFSSTGGFMKARNLSEALPSMMAQAFDHITYIRQISKNQSFDIVFMPICGLRDGLVHHFEALTRFRDTFAGASPYQLISLAEEADLIRDLDIAIIMKVIQSINDLTRIDAHKRRYLPPVAVNVSGASIANYNFTHKLYQLLSTDINMKDRLMLEITESAKIERLSDVNKSLQMFRNKGFTVCIDDFGAGAASIDYLHMLDVDVVKFDGPVVKRAVSSPKGSEVLAVMAHMCRDMRIETVAEMIEDKAMADKALECGVDLGQGYHFGKLASNPFIFNDKFAPIS
ncbi:MAG: EAL domain, partial [Rhodospirillaceae bacterium]